MKDKLKKISEYEWELDKNVRPKMNVKAKIIGNKMVVDSLEDAAVQQLTNVATLPGIIEPVIGLPDMHWGYGLPMGAVSAFDSKEGIISSGLCGFDINCGVNSIRTSLSYDQVKPKLNELISALFKNIPCGVGAKGKLKLTNDQLDQVLTRGIEWAIENGFGTKRDKEHMEENGRMEGGDPSKVSDLAKKRGLQQLGTLGAGNHFLEIQRVSDIYDEEKAREWGIEKKDQVVLMLHCGSRGLGHQVASDYLKIQEQAVKKYNIWLPDRQLACAPASSREGQDYFSAMVCAVNYSFTNRLVMTHWIRETFEKVFGMDWESMNMQTIYGLCHNVVKLEEHTINGEKRKVFVHRKGSTRSFPNDPVLIAGTMGTSSYLLKGTEKAMEKTFGSTVHGAGRAMSRHAAIRKFWGGKVKEDLASKGIVAQSTHPKVLAEEAPGAYKNVDDVIESVHGIGISLKVAKTIPIGVCKG
ncbi:MAG: RNA-splicing ligase RtcB [Candidatus Aenigmarchaeota archaeon]|nr:RNA-splicing ligase RtcB [Candidatus Aenigmarchaeota archaeon]